MLPMIEWVCERAYLDCELVFQGSMVEMLQALVDVSAAVAVVGAGQNGCMQPGLQLNSLSAVRMSGIEQEEGEQHVAYSWPTSLLRQTDESSSADPATHTLHGKTYVCAATLPHRPTRSHLPLARNPPPAG